MCRMTVPDLKNGWADCIQIWYTDRDRLVGCRAGQLELEETHAVPHVQGQGSTSRSLVCRPKRRLSGSYSTQYSPQFCLLPVLAVKTMVTSVLITISCAPYTTLVSSKFSLCYTGNLLSFYNVPPFPEVMFPITQITFKRPTKPAKLRPFQTAPPCRFSGVRFSSGRRADGEGYQARGGADGVPSRPSPISRQISSGEAAAGPRARRAGPTVRDG